MKRKNITRVQDYIELISDIIASKDDDRFIITYRGECKEYSTPCVPNIYREDYLKNYQFFEKNIFDEKLPEILIDYNSIYNYSNYLTKKLNKTEQEKYKAIDELASIRNSRSWKLTSAFIKGIKRIIRFRRGE